MISLDSTTFYVLLEALAVLAGGCGMLVFVAMQRARRRKMLMIDLVHRLKSAGSQRMATLEAQIKQKKELNEAQAHDVAQQILAAETHFYQYLVKALLQVDDRQLIELDREVELLTDSIAKAAPVVDVAASHVGTAQVNAEQITQLLGTMEKNHSQLLGEIKKSAETIRTGLTNLQGVPMAAVASAAAGAVTTSAAPPTAVAAPAAAHDALEELPDIDDSPAAAPSTDLESLPDIEDSLPAAAPDTPIEAASTAADVGVSDDAFEQIAEMPDGSLDMDTTPTVAPPAPVAAEPAFTLEAQSDTPTTPLPAAQPAPEAAAAPVATAMTNDDIDALLANAAPAAPTAPKQAEPAPATSSSAASIDEMYANEPLIPEAETEIAPTAADNPVKASDAAPATPAPGNVDDLLAELDALLK